LEGGIQFDIYSSLADGSGGAIPIAVNATFDELFVGVTAGGLVVFNRDTNAFSRNVDGSGSDNALAPTANTEQASDVTASGLVIITRTTISFPTVVTDLVSVDASGAPGETLLASASADILLVTGELIVYGGSTPAGRVIFQRCDLILDCDVFSRNEDGSGTEAILAANAGEIEVFSGVSSDGLVIITREIGGVGGTTELISVNADGSGGENLLATSPTPTLPNGEVFKGVTANGRVIFEREVGGGPQTDLFSILADGSAAEVPLADGGTNESFGGLF
ncbi:MAG: hypothetical protein OEN02_16300, partial [Gammaproteobacteria bacterium]|nr:hypothetical protein [Gammaproteobacteria bacterium]